MPTDVDLKMLRAAYRRESDYLRFASRRTQRTLRAIIRNARFPGATDPAVLEILGALVSATRPKRVLQLGTYVGFSALFVADIIARHSGVLVTVDPDRSAHELARSFSARARLDNIVFIDGSSTDESVLAELWRRGPFEIVYLDSSHAYGETLKELDIIFSDDSPLLVDEGLLLLHDVAAGAAAFDPSGQGGVRRALDEWLASRRPRPHLILEPPLFQSSCGVAIVASASGGAPAVP